MSLELPRASSRVPEQREWGVTRSGAAADTACCCCPAGTRCRERWAGARDRCRAVLILPVPLNSGPLGSVPCPRFSHRTPLVLALRSGKGRQLSAASTSSSTPLAAFSAQRGVSRPARPCPPYITSLWPFARGPCPFQPNLLRLAGSRCTQCTGRSRWQLRMAKRAQIGGWTGYLRLQGPTLARAPLAFQAFLQPSPEVPWRGLAFRSFRCATTCSCGAARARRGGRRTAHGARRTARSICIPDPLGHLLGQVLAAGAGASVHWHGGLHGLLAGGSLRIYVELGRSGAVDDVRRRKGSQSPLDECMSWDCELRGRGRWHWHWHLCGLARAALRWNTTV